MNNRDDLFSGSDNPRDFEFDKDVANVFDDMVSRSVPFYNELQDAFIKLTSSFAQPNSAIYDLGCSTCTTLAKVAEKIEDPTVCFVGVDNSDSMIDKAKQKLEGLGFSDRCSFVCQDLNDEVEIENASVVYLNWTLQFVRPLNRDRLMRKIFAGLKQGGALIVAEKVVVADSLLNRLYIDYYYDYKRQQHYSDEQIAQKREALENVLIPFRVDENIELMKRAGFQTVDVFFRWFNWAGFLAIKR